MDLEDLLYITFDTGRVTVEDLFNVVKKEGFEAEVRSGE